MAEPRNENIIQQSTTSPLKTTVNTVKGGTYSLILRALDLAKNDPVIVLDAQTAKAHRDTASLIPLTAVRTQINDYVEVLLTQKGEKKIIAEQTNQKNQQIDTQLIDMQKKQEALEEQYQQFKQLKQLFEMETQGQTTTSPYRALLEEFKTKSMTYREKLEDQYQQTKQLKQTIKRDQPESENLNTLKELKNKSKAYRKEVEKFNKQVQQIQFNLDKLKLDIKFHTSLDLQRKIENPLQRIDTLHH